MKAALMIAAEEGGGRGEGGKNVETLDIGFSGIRYGAEQINESPWQKRREIPSEPRQEP